MTPTIESLPGKWRDAADEATRSLASTKLAEEMRIALRAESIAYRQCARVLETALATQPKDGELLALSQRLAAQANLESPPADDLLLEAATALRTLASPRVTVDAVLAYLRLRGYECADKRTFRDDLTAAMQPDTLSKSQINRIALERGESPGRPGSGDG